MDVLPAAGRAALDRAISAGARAMLRAFFRSVEVEGRERIPSGLPLLLVANHVNSVVDPLLLLAFVHGRTRMLAKSTLWSHPVMGPLLRLAGALPVYRRQDAGEDVTRNFSTFARCYDALAHGGSVALFPEGTSHNHPGRLPLKTGAARIALETLARHPASALRVLPVGIVYEAKGRFRSRALLNVGDAVDPAPEAERYAAGARDAVRRLTLRIASGLEPLAASYDSWEQGRLVELAAALVGGGTLAERFARTRDMRVRYRELDARQPEQAAALVRSLRRYEARLQEEGVTEGDIESPGPAQSWLSLALLLPVAAIGVALNALPYRLTSWTARRFARTPDEPATYMLLTGLLTFPACWLLTGLAAGLALGPAWGLAAALLAPATGPAALRLREASKQARRPRPSARLLAQRQALIDAIRRLS